MRLRRSIVGIDCATDPRRVGLALADASHACTEIVEVATGSEGNGDPANRISEWLKGTETALLAIDAPLGWPAQLGRDLGFHQAGGPIETDANQLFRRETDRTVQRRVGRRPLEVGADRIARTALAALGLLEKLRRRFDEPIPLAWDPEKLDRISAIEVYPAGTLAAHGITASGYKKPDQTEVRREMLERLARLLTLPGNQERLEGQADILDAAVCVQAGCDFLRGRAIAPTNLTLAKKEGWIWVCPADTGS